MTLQLQGLADPILWGIPLEPWCRRAMCLDGRDLHD